MKKLLSRDLILRFGLACAFLANSLTAFLYPDEFKEVISGSFISHFLPISVSAFVIFVGINDLIVAILLLLGWKVSKVAIWASIWITGVIIVNGVISLDSLERLAFLAIAIFIAFRVRTDS